MRLQDIKTEQNILDFIEGSLNDFESGEASKNETISNIVDLLEFTSKRYATACVKASLERAADNALVEDDSMKIITKSIHGAWANKASISNLDNIVLL